MWAIFWCLFGLTLFILLSQALFQSASLTHIIWITIISAALGFLTAPENKIYKIPKKDLIAIKDRPLTHQVTVVFDDEKNKIEGLQ